MAELPTDIPGDRLRAWLEQTPEEIIDPDQPIIDPHHHLWDRRPRPELPAGERQHLRYLADDLIEDIRGAGHNVVDTVFVECRSMYGRDDAVLAPVGETAFVQGVAAMAASGLYGDDVRCCGAIVGFADLTAGPDEVETVLRGHLRAGVNFRGIRHAHTWHASSDIPNSHHPTRDIEGLLGRDDFREGFAVLDRLGLTFDAWGYFTQLGEVEDLARTFPNTTIIVDHIGGPVAMGPLAAERDGKVFDEWREAVTALADCPNVAMKLGGCGMTSYGWGYAAGDSPPDSAVMAAAWKPYFEVLIGAYGPGRAMFESNFPVDKVSCSYAGLWNAFKRVADDLGVSPTDRNELFYGAAARAYRMPLTSALQRGLEAPVAEPGDRYGHVLALFDCFQEARYGDMLEHFAPGAVTVQHLGPRAGEEHAVTDRTVEFMARHNPPCLYSNRRQTFAHDRFIEQHTVTWPGEPDRAGQSIETVIVVALDGSGRVTRLDEYGDPATLEG